jgi:hypothetical protein
MAPGSQEASFLTVVEEAVPTTSVSKKSFSFTLNRAGTPEEGSSSESESEELPASRELCISKSLLLNLPGKEERPKPGHFTVLLLEEPAGEAKLS